MLTKAVLTIEVSKIENMKPISNLRIQLGAAHRQYSPLALCYLVLVTWLLTPPSELFS